MLTRSKESYLRPSNAWEQKAVCARTETLVLTKSWKLISRNRLCDLQGLAEAKSEPFETRRANVSRWNFVQLQIPYMVDGMSDIISITMCCSHLVTSIMLVKTKQIVEELARPS